VLGLCVAQEVQNIAALERAGVWPYPSERTGAAQWIAAPAVDGSDTGTMLKNGGRGSLDARRLAGYGFIAGMVLAPFLALIYGGNAGLGVMTFALASTTYLVADVWRTADPATKVRLRPLLALNALLTLICLAILILRVV
jgi:hypothetical protein